MKDSPVYGLVQPWHFVILFVSLFITKGAAGLCQGCLSFRFLCCCTIGLMNDRGLLFRLVSETSAGTAAGAADGAVDAAGAADGATDGATDGAAGASSDAGATSDACATSDAGAGDGA